MEDTVYTARIKNMYIEGDVTKTYTRNFEGVSSNTTNAQALLQAYDSLLQSDDHSGHMITDSPLDLDS